MKQKWYCWLAPNEMPEKAPEIEAETADEAARLFCYYVKTDMVNKILSHTRLTIPTTHCKTIFHEVFVCNKATKKLDSFNIWARVNIELVATRKHWDSQDSFLGRMKRKLFFALFRGKQPLDK